MTDQNNLPANPQPKTQVAAEAPKGVKGLIQSPAIRKRFDDMLGKRAPSFLSSVLSAVSGNKMLMECDPMSVISSAAVAAALDLPVNSSLGFAHIVPYNSKEGKVAQFQLGWKGFVQLAMRSGQYKTINLTPVFEGQIKRHNQFTGDMEFDHDVYGEGDPVGYLLYFKLLNGYEKYFYMTAEQCHQHGKRYSKSYAKNYGQWVDDFDAMALKTVCKMGLSKYGVLSVDMQKAFESDQAEIGEDGQPKYIDARDVTPPAASEAPSTVKSINEKIAAKRKAKPTVEGPQAEEVNQSGAKESHEQSEHF